MSGRAAWRLEALGFEQVYRYQAGKDDWLVAQLPMEGREANVQRAVDVARRDVPTCGLSDSVAEVARQVRQGGWPLAVVVNEQRIVLGRLRPRDLEADADAIAADMMLDGPRTVRGTRPVEKVAAWLDERHIRGVLITSADGELIGYVRLDDL